MDGQAEQFAALERRIRRLEAVEEIKRLKYRYWRACDAKDPEGFRDCFVKSGADLDYGALGMFSDRDALTEVYAGLALRRAGEQWLLNDIHHGKHPVIDVIDDRTATGDWTFWFMQVNLEASVVIQQSMEYRDRYAVEDGAWRIQRSHVHALTGITVPIAPGAVIAPGPPVPAGRVSA
jgi:hypothetical protein